VFEQVTDEGQIAQRLAHFFAFLVYHSGMHPGTRKWRYLCKMFGLCNLTGVMREGKVNTSAVNVQLLAKVAHCHRAALDMPAWTSRPPRTWPRGFARGLSLPEHKIKGVFFTRIIRIVAALVGNGQHGVIVVEANSSSHDAKLGVLFDAKIDAAV